MFSSLLRDGIVAAIVLPIILVGLILITLAAEFVGIDPHEEWFSLILIPFVILGLYQLAKLMPTGLGGMLAGFALWGGTITIGYYFFHDTLMWIGSWFDIFVT